MQVASTAIRRTAPDHDRETEGAAPSASPPRTIELDVEALPASTPPLACADAPEKTTLYVDGISPSDVRQGEIGDCTLQASLSSLARTLPGKAFLRGRIHENRDRAGGAASYTVSLYRKTSAGAFQPVKVDVPARCLASRGFAHAVSADGEVEAWPRVFEQAMLTVNGGKPCHDMPEAMGILTGKPAVDSPTSEAGLESALLRGFGAGKVQVLSTTGALAADLDDPKLKAGHAYTLVGVEAHPQRRADGSYEMTLLYTVRNPWGYDQPRPLTIDEVRKYFSTYSQGDVP